MPVPALPPQEDADSWRIGERRSGRGPVYIFIPYPGTSDRPVRHDLRRFEWFLDVHQSEGPGGLAPSGFTFGRSAEQDGWKMPEDGPAQPPPAPYALL